MCRLILFKINSLGFCLGLAVMVLGLLTEESNKENFKISQYLHNAGIAFIAIGGAILLVSFFGILANCTCQTSRPLVMIYISLVIILLIAEAGGAIAFYLLYDKETFRKDLLLSLQYYSSNKDVKKFWDFVMADLECCGVNSYVDWGNSLPNSCCHEIDVNDVCHMELAYEKGCFNEIVKNFQSYYPIMLISIACIQVFCIVSHFMSSLMSVS